MCILNSWYKMEYLKIVQFILVIYIFQIMCSVCCFQSTNLNKKGPTSSSEKSEEEYTDFYINCTIPNYSKRQVYHSGDPTERDSYNYPATPVCLRCAICITIAEKMNETLTLAYLGSYARQMNDSDGVLRSLCTNGFENFGLRRFETFHLVTDAISATEHIASYLDGKWTQKLREMCNFYLNEFGEEKLYYTWMTGGDYPKYDMINNLCRSGGVFRDCLNIEDQVITLVRKKHCCLYSKKTEIQFRVVCS